MVAIDCQQGHCGAHPDVPAEANRKLEAAAMATWNSIVQSSTWMDNGLMDEELVF